MKKLLFLALLLYALGINAQEPNTKLFEQIRSLDSAMFSVVYHCDAAKIRTYFSEDLEFYHDKGGVTKSLNAFMVTQQKNFCGEKPFYLRRATVPGTMQVFPMDNYGAIQTGEHVFYVKGSDGKEVLDGKAKYTHLWRFENGQWQITRVFSYDHGPAR